MPASDNDESYNVMDDMSSPSNQQKAKKRLGKLIKRTFAKHKPPPPASANAQVATAGGGGGGKLNVSTDYDPLLGGGGVIHVNSDHNYNNALESPSITMDSVQSGGLSSQQQSPNPHHMNTYMYQQHARHHQYQHQQQQQHARHSPPRPTTGHHHPSIPHAETEDDDEHDFHPTETHQQRLRRISKAQDKIKTKMEWSRWHCFLFVVLYVALTVVLFSFYLEKDKWSYLDSSYFAGT